MNGVELSGWGTELEDLNILDSVLTDPAMIEPYGRYGVDADGDGKADPYSKNGLSH
ncbi:hypothetical protein [Ammoniphilus sp. 3BR4]|uniref:hypothetical protein n=1 Tax=Ammoniphilus sp. 3BR4 TaxID=3158265 RepID=UPI003467B2F8